MPVGQDEQRPITQLLLRWSTGDAEAFDELVPLVYDELRLIADRQLRREAPGHTLPGTAIVHEAYLRLIDQKQAQWKDRAHFFGVAARLVRQILVDHARAKKAEKRGSGQIAVSLDEAQVAAPMVDLLELDGALMELNKVDEVQTRIVELRFFSGMTVEETAACMGLEPHVVKHEWSMARAWLYRYLKRG